MTVEAILRLKGREVVTASPDTTLEEAARLLSKHRIGALVISRDGRSVDGILSERDIVRALSDLGQAALGAPAAKTMTRKVVVCSLSDHVDSLMGIMTDRRVRHLPVRSEEHKSELQSLMRI